MLLRKYRLRRTEFVLGRRIALFAKIEEAAAKQIIIPEVKTWAHESRLAADEECQPDLDDATTDDAQQCVEFALALAQTFLSYQPGSRVVWIEQRAKLKGAAIVKASSMGDLQVKQ